MELSTTEVQVSEDDVQLQLPAAPEYARIARLTVAGLASRVGFGYDDVEDLRIAVGEACSLLLHGAPREASLQFAFHLDDDSLRIDARRDPADPGDAQRSDDDSLHDTDLSLQILEAVVDHAAVDSRAATVHLVKDRTDR